MAYIVMAYVQHPSVVETTYMCNVPRKAVVRGRLENGVLTVTEMRLLP